jgi:hypothetical protein
VVAELDDGGGRGGSEAVGHGGGFWMVVESWLKVTAVAGPPGRWQGS